MRTNVAPAKATPVFTHEGASAARINPFQELRRSVLACMLGEDNFYESGENVIERIKTCVAKCKPQQVADLAVEARTKFKLRHVPLLLVRELAKSPLSRHVVADALAEIIQRPDELAEFLALYWKDDREDGEALCKRNNGKGQPIAAQVKKGLAKAFQKFNEYSLAKYNQQNTIKLRDVLFLTHAKPKDAEQADLWKRLIDGKLQTPDTWEVEISATTDKKTSWERLLREDKLGGLALLRNLRNMKEAGVSEDLVFDALTSMKTDRVLPFRFIAASNHVPQWEPGIEVAMLKCLNGVEKLPGKTVLVVDNSGSMYGTKISEKSELDRSDAACALAILVREICEKCEVISFSTYPAIVPARRGFALRDSIKSATTHGGTSTDAALATAQNSGYDRIIVITDEQSQEAVRQPLPHTKGYFVNVACYQNGIGYGPWTSISGFSEAILDFIRESEQSNAN